MNLAERDAAAIWHPFTQVQGAGPPLAVMRGEGALLFDASGTAYVDAISSWWVNLHGHAHPQIARRIAEQAAELCQVIFAGATHPRAVELAERLLAILPPNQSRVFFSDDGSTAVEAALKMAIQYWHNRGEKRRKIVALAGGYHGDTFGAMSVAERGGFTVPFRPFLFSCDLIEPPAGGAAGRSAAQLESLLAGGDVAAFIFEPLVQGAGGMRMHSGDGLSRLLQMCREQGVLCIADEVMTGFGRTGTLFASELLATPPDLFCLSKGLTGGTLPLGVTTATDNVFEAFVSEERLKMFLHGHSYTANAISCAAALASLDLLQEAKCRESIARITQRHAGFAAELRANSAAENVRQTGTILAFDIRASGETGYDHPLRDRIYRHFIDRRVLLRPLGNVVYIMPPYCITDEQLGLVYDAIRSALQELV